jgi:hypothetical protein
MVSAAEPRKVGERAVTRRAAISSWAFLLSFYLGLEAYLWLIVPTKETAWIAAGAVVILAVIVLDPWRRRESPASVGLTFRNAGPAAKLLLFPTLAAGLLLVLIHAAAAGAPETVRFTRRFVQILPWALLQQGLLQATYNKRLQALLGPGLRSSLVNGLFFAGMHLPGLFLVVMTFVAGTWWSRVYQKRPNLWVLILSHAVLSALAQTLLPPAWTHGFRVGPGYFRWH